MKKFLIVILVVYLSFIVFMPKTNLWFTSERLIKKQGVIVSKEEVKDLGLFFSLKNGEVYYDGLKAFTIGDVKIFPFLFFNQIILKNLTSSDETKSLINFSISYLKLTNSVIKPFSLFLEGKGSIGEFKGDADLKKRVLKITLFSPSKYFLSNRNIRRYFKKSKEGYVYEYHF